MNWISRHWLLSDQTTIITTILNISKYNHKTIQYLQNYIKITLKCGHKANKLYSIIISFYLYNIYYIFNISKIIKAKINKKLIKFITFSVN